MSRSGSVRFRSASRFVRVAAIFGSILVSTRLAACDASRPAADAGVPEPVETAAPLSDSAFSALVEELSGPGGYFDTDNLVSNETSYLHVLGALRERGVRGGAYVGVGPDQNFAYIAEVRPRIAFVVDIRRDNLLQHLLFKALFEVAPTRIEYLSLLLGRPAPEDPAAWRDRSVEELVAWVDSVPFRPGAAERARFVVDSAVVTWGIPLDSADRATIRRFHDTFIDAGADLRFRSHGRAPRPYYPTLRRLLVERDLEGRPGSHLADAGDYAFLRELQRKNLVVPVVGDFAGEHAFSALAELLGRRGEEITLLYASNVEFYLYRSGTFDRFAENVRRLPIADGAVLVRSYFPSAYGRHPHAVDGYWSTQTLQTLRSFVETAGGEGYGGYLDLVTRHAIDPREEAGASGVGS